jgi:quercetin dioxygenase-like cupin family protein
VRNFAAASAVAVTMVGAAAAQQYSTPTPELSGIPVDQEPQHKVVFANDAVRVIDARFPPGNMSLKHGHAADHVTIVIASGRDTAEGRARAGRAEFSKGGYSHIVMNPEAGELRLFEVEPLTSGSIAPDPRPLPAHTLELENNRVRIYRIVLASGQSIAGHSHGHGWLGVVVKGSTGVGTYQWHAAGSREAFSNTGTTPLEIVEIEPK